MSRRHRQLIAKVRALRGRDWLELLDAQLALIRAQLIVATRARGKLIDRHPPTGTAASEGPSVDDARRLGIAVSRAARFGVFRPQCLVRSLALYAMLERRGIRGSRIRIGVRRDGEQIAAHAWVEYGDFVLGDHDAHVASFTELADVRMRTS
jgi:hypothetical protein